MLFNHCTFRSMHRNCIIVLSNTYWLSIWVTWRVSYKRQELLLFRKNLGSPYVFGGARVLIFLIFCVVLCFVCLRPVSCVPNVASFSVLSILDCPLRFSLTFIYRLVMPLEDNIGNAKQIIKSIHWQSANKFEQSKTLIDRLLFNVNWAVLQLYLNSQAINRRGKRWIPGWGYEAMF